MSGLGLYTQLAPTEAAAIRLRAMSLDYMVLVDEALLWARWLPDLYHIFRPYGLIPDSYTLPESPDLCFREGQAKAEATLHLVRPMPGVRGLISLNERQPQNEADAKRIGAFEGGFASVVCAAGLDHHAFNWSMGFPRSELVVAAWAEAMERTPAWCRNRVILAYHAYTETAKQVDAPHFELRPWAYWQRLFGFAGLAWPRVSLTECGYDNRHKVPRNGWEHSLTEQEYADYLRRLVYLTPNAFCRVVFGWRMTDDWREKGFEVEGHEVVETTIGNINGVATPIGEETMPQSPEQLAHEIWDMAFRWPELPKPAGFNPNTGIGAYREGHPLLGMPLSNEYARDTWPVVMMVFAGGVALWHRVSGKTAGAMTEGDVRTLLAGPFRP